MKNFSMKRKDSKMFILKYRVEESQIRISLASIRKVSTEKKLAIIEDTF